MAPQAGNSVDGATTLTDIQDSVLAIASNNMLVSEFSPVVKDPEKMLLKLCCG